MSVDPAFGGIVSATAKVEKVAGNFGFTEGPVWVRKGGYLIFSDIPANVINRWNPGDGKVSVYLEKSGFTGSDPTGVGGEQTQRAGGDHLPDRIERCDARPARPRDVQRDGRSPGGARRGGWAAYGAREPLRGKTVEQHERPCLQAERLAVLTDPPSGLRRRNDDPKKELPFNGVFLLKGDTLHLLARGI